MIEKIKTARGHSYKLDGEQVPGVTTLIGGGMPKPALLKWAPRTVAEYVADNLDQVSAWRAMGRFPLVNMLKSVPWAQRDAAANRGTEVHKLAEKLSHGEEVEVPEELAGHVKSCIEFLDEWEVRPVITEGVVGSRQWKYCGSFDGVADFKGGSRKIFDYKTSKSGIFPETAYQLAGYAHAEVYVDADGKEQPVSSLGIEGGYGVWIRTDGYDVFPLDISEQTFKDFLHICWVARCAKSNKSLVGEALMHSDWGTS